MDRAVRIEKSLEELRKRIDQHEDRFRMLTSNRVPKTVATPEAAAKVQHDLAEYKQALREKEIDIAVHSRFMGSIDKPTEREIAAAAAATRPVSEAKTDLDNQRAAPDAETAAGFTPEKLAARRKMIGDAERKYDELRLKYRELQRLALVNAGRLMAGDVQRRLDQHRLEASEIAGKCQLLERNLQDYEQHLFDEDRLKLLREDLKDLHDLRRKLQRERLELELGR